MHNKEVYFIFKNRVAKYSMETGTEILQKEFPTYSFGELKYFVGSQVYITSQKGDLLNLRQSDSTNVFVFTNQSKTLSIDKNLNLNKNTDYNDLGICYQQTKSFKLIVKDKNTLIVNNEGKRIAEVGATSKAFMIGNTLYDTQDNSFIIIDLNKIKENK